MKIIISYANKPYFYRSQQQLVNSAKQYFDGHISYHPGMIGKEFYEKNKHILTQERGGGYWLWKGYIIRDALNLVKDGDYVFYVDSGNTVIDNPQPLFDLVDKEKSGILLFENRDGTHNDKEVKGGIWQNYMFTKYDCFKLMDCLDEKYTHGNQIDASYILVKKNNFAVSFFEEYLNYCQDEHVITDTANKYGDNFPGFRDHRHDQSILSLLAIKYNLTLAREPSEWGNYVKSEKYLYPQIFFHHRGLA